MEHFRQEVQLGCQSHSQGDDNNAVLRTLEAGSGCSWRSPALGEGGSARRLGASDAAPAAGPVSPALSSRVAGGASPGQSAGGGPGNGRARVASAAAPVYYCDSNYFLLPSSPGECQEREPGDRKSVV